MGSGVARVSTRFKVVALAASTGGPKALSYLLSKLPTSFGAAILIVQHLPPQFVASFAERLSQTSPLPVRVARQGEVLVPGQVLVAPGDRHLLLVGSGPPNGEWRVQLSTAPPLGGHRPSADPLFASLADVCGPYGIGVVLTGMGSDGTKGLLALRQAGGLTLGESSVTCSVFGMPRSAWEGGALERLLPLWDLPMALSTAVAATFQ